jgi:hypothetical protein
MAVADLNEQIKFYERSVGRALTSDEVANVEHYGVLHPSELRPDDDWYDQDLCGCGKHGCKEEYVHMTSGY